MTRKPTPAGRLSPDEAFARAQAAHRAGRLDEAEALCRGLLEIAPGHPDVLHLLGVLRGQQGRPDEALELIGRAVDSMPRVAAFQFNLGNVQLQLKRWQDAASSFGRALEIDPGNGEAAFNLGFALSKQGRRADAVPAFRRAVAANPGDQAAAAELAGCLGELGEVDEALAVQGRVLARAPEVAGYWANLGLLRLRRREWDVAVEAFDEALAREPWHVPALANKGVALFEAGRDEDAARLIDLDGLIELGELPLPPGAGRQVLADALAGHSSRVWQPSDTTTRDGAQTGNLIDDPDPVIRAFISAYVETIEAFVRSRTPDPGRPFLARIPASWRYSIWATILERDGHQAPHLHPAGWLSGVCYLEVPDAVMSAENDAQQGWIEFGAPGYGIEPVRPPVARRIRPEPGKLVLFPSYFFHRTIPLAGGQRRISVAFDLIPTAWRED